MIFIINFIFLQIYCYLSRDKNNIFLMMLIMETTVIEEETTITLPSKLVIALELHGLRFIVSVETHTLWLIREALCILYNRKVSCLIVSYCWILAYDHFMFLLFNDWAYLTIYLSFLGYQLPFKKQLKHQHSLMGIPFLNKNSQMDYMSIHAFLVHNLA